MMQHHTHHILSFAAMICCYMGTSSGIVRAVDVTLSLRGKSRYCLVVRLLLLELLLFLLLLLLLLVLLL